MQMLELFVFLQVLDLFTTLLGFRLGAGEVSPFIRTLISSTDPVTGVVLAKTIALGIGAVCIATRRYRLIGWINYGSAALVIWNFLMLFRAVHIL